MKKLLSIFAAALIGLSCGGATEFEIESPRNKPIKNTGLTDTIIFQKAICEIPTGEVIGGVYRDLVKIQVKEYFAAELADEQYQQVFEEVFLNELEKAGYNCISKNVLFDTTNSNARFLLGAVITDARLNDFIYTSKHGVIVYAQFSEALLDIRWEIYDTREKKIFFSRNELGTTKRADNKLDAYTQAVRISFRNFLAEKELPDALKKQILKYPSQPN
jgi:hypothetical protein